MTPPRLHDNAPRARGGGGAGRAGADGFRRSRGQFNAVKTVKTSVLGTINMLGLAKRVKARILLASTSEVYGDPLEHPQREAYWGNVNPIGERACYDEGKRVAETLMFDYNRQHEVDIRVARIFNTYGPRMAIDDGRVVSNFVAQALRGEPLTVYEPGNQTRSFCFVSDLVDGLMRLMEGDEQGPVNLGNPREFTILELAQVVKETINPGVEIVMNANTPDDPRQRKPDISKAKATIGWEPKVRAVRAPSAPQPGPAPVRPACPSPPAGRSAAPPVQIPLRQGLPMMAEEFKVRMGLGESTRNTWMLSHDDL